MDKSLLLANARIAEHENRLQDAVDILHKGLRSFPGDGDIVVQMGNVLLNAQKFSDAQAIFGRMLKPREGKMPVAAAIGYGKALISQEKFREAKGFLEPITKQLPNNPEVVLCQIKLAIHEKKLEDAAALIAHGQRIAPRFRPYTHEKGRLAAARGEIDEAIEIFETNVDRSDPLGDSIDAWLDLLRQNNRELYARKKLREYTESHPERPEFIFGLAVTYSRAGELDNAREAFKASDAILPNNYRIIYELAVLERLAGNLEYSRQLLERVLTLKPDHAPAVRTYGVDHNYSYGDTFFQRLNSLAADIESLTAMEQIQTHFALGKAFDDVAELGTAFRHFAVGGLKKRKIDKFLERDGSRMFDVMKQMVNSQTLPGDPSKGYADPTATFILGMPRSGTSLMEQILSSHPDIYGAGELKHITSALENIETAGRRIKLGNIEPAFDYDLNAGLADRGRWYTDMIKSIADRPYRRIVDKMPGNFNFVGMIHAILPNAKIIHSRRHPVETCLSCYRILFAEGHQWTYDLGQLGRYYKNYWGLMKHWREQYPGVMYEVRYEDNVADVEGQAKRLIEYLGLEWDENCLNFYNTDRPVKTASATQVRRPIYTTSTNRWRKYEKYLGPLMDEIGDIVEQYEAEIEHLK